MWDAYNNSKNIEGKKDLFSTSMYDIAFFVHIETMIFSHSKN